MSCDTRRRGIGGPDAIATNGRDHAGSRGSYADNRVQSLDSVPVPQQLSQVRHISVDADHDGQRADNFLMAVLPGVPRSHVYRLLRSGQVRVDGSRSKPDRRLRAGETVRVPPVRLEERQARRPPDAMLQRLRGQILFEDNDYLALDKPAGVAAHAGSGVDFGAIEVVRAWERYGFIELAHRLDRDTSGILLLAKSRPALLRAQKAFSRGQARKRYLALCCGAWRGGAREVDAPLAMQREGGNRRARGNAEGKRAVSRFDPLSIMRLAALCEVHIGTGRMHQIRAHAESIGHPVAGDRKYGQREQHRAVREKGGLKRLFLHAHRLDLPPAEGFDALSVESPLPEDLRAVVTRLEAPK